MAKSCKELAVGLFECVKKTPCVKAGGGIRECMKQGNECQDLRNAYFACKRGALDMRTRIQGPKAY
eukprot:gene12888-17269_t